jgi:hypothetical protein
VKGLAGTVTAALVLVTGAGRAFATDWFTLIDWACDPKNRNGTAGTIKADALSECDLTENGPNVPSICGTVAGTPTACNTLSPVEAGFMCHEADARISIVVGSGSALGWSVEGEVVARAYFRAKFDGGECETTPIEPTPTGAAGTFIKSKGVINVLAQFRAEGTGSVKFLGGTIFSTTKKAACDNTMQIWAHTTDVTNTCTKPTCRRRPAADMVDGELDETASEADLVYCDDDEDVPPPPTPDPEPAPVEDPTPIDPIATDPIATDPIATDPIEHDAVPAS